MYYQVDHLIYAAGSELRNTIRAGITLKETVDVSVLRRAVDRLRLRFPYYSVRLVRNGESLFYKYNKKPYIITADAKTVVLGSEQSNNHLVAFAYSGNTVFIDSTHFLMDGCGQFPFIKMLLYEYLHEIYPDEQFDTSDIPQVHESISQEELTDSPYPDEILSVDFPKIINTPGKAFMLDERPTGYENISEWMSFRLKLKQSEVMDYASSTDGSPATFISAIVYRAISDNHPDNHLPIVCGMQHQFRRALGNNKSHSSHVRIVPITYPSESKNRDIDFLNTIGRGTLIIKGSDDQDIHAINEYINNRKRIKNYIFSRKHLLMRRIVLSAIGKNTYEVSYVGRVNWNGLDKYITCFTPYLDMNLSGGLSVEIFGLGEYFDINIMQRNNDDKYVKRMDALLEGMGIECIWEKPEHFEICDFQIP